MLNRISSNCSQSTASLDASLDRILHNGLLDTACNKLLEHHSHKSGRDHVGMDSSARTFVVNYTVDIVKDLCNPTFPVSCNEVNDRMQFSFPPKLIPPDAHLDELRVMAEKGKKRTICLSADKVVSNLKWSVNYGTKLNAGVLVETDVQHLTSLFGTPQLTKTTVSQSLPFMQPRPGDYAGNAKELQFFLRSCVEHLGVVVRIFGDVIVEELTQVIHAARSTGMEATAELMEAAQLGKMVFIRASELYNHLMFLSECVEDVFEAQTFLLGTCLLEPAEDETFLSFAYYTEALFKDDCRNWTHMLAETPCLVRALNNAFQNILRIVKEKASSRRLAELEARYSHPHACNLCYNYYNNPSGSEFATSPLYSTLASSSSYNSNSSQLGDSPQNHAPLALLNASTTGDSTTSIRGSQCSDPVGSISVPHSQSPWTGRGQYTNSLPVQMMPTTRRHRSSIFSTTMPLRRKNKKQRATRRSVSGSPPPPTIPPPAPSVTVPGGVPRPATNTISDGTTDEDRAGKQRVFLDIGGLETGLSTSSSSSSALNETGAKSHDSQDGGSYDPHHTGMLGDPDEQPVRAQLQSPCSSNNSNRASPQEIKARLMELLPPVESSATSCSHMVIAFRYLLPQLLQLPVLQLLYLYEIIEALHTHAPNENERNVLSDVLSLLSKTRLAIQNSIASEDWIKTAAPHLANYMKTPLRAAMMASEVRGNLEELVQSARRVQLASEKSISVSEFILDGVVFIRPEGTRTRRSNRLAYLFNNWLLVCKKQRRVLTTVVSSASGSSTHSGWKLEKRIPLEQFHLVDTGVEITDNNETLFTFDLEYWEVPRRGSLVSTANTPWNPSSTGTTAASGSLQSADLQSIYSMRSSQASRSISPPPPPSAFPPPPLSQSTVTPSVASIAGSMLSISTLTSTSTLIGPLGGSLASGRVGQPHHHSNAAPDGSVDMSSMMTPSIATMPPLLPTARSAVTAESAAIWRGFGAKQRMTFLFSTQASKADWLAALVYLQLSRFSAPDSITNITFEADLMQDSSVEIPVIRAASLLKLIERMTYHVYFDSKTVNIFLLIYRRYLSPLELLELLSERFNVPDPDFTEAAEQVASNMGDGDSIITATIRLEKRFRSGYKRHVKYRVLNFIIKWVKNVSFLKKDILPDPAVCKRMSEFLDSVDTRSLMDNVANIRRSLRGDRVRMVQTIQQLPPDQLDFGLVSRPLEVKLTNVHPVELARQITLHEWELYSRIEFWEVDGKEKIKAPNLQASLDFSNNIKWWLVQSIMSADNMEDRLVVMLRVADLAIQFEQLNNLQGTQEAKAALLNSSVHRLHNTFAMLLSKAKPHHRAFFEALVRSVETDEGDAYVADYEKKLHEVNPPGLPFIAVGGKTQLIHLELKYPDWITVPNTSAGAVAAAAAATPTSGAAAAAASTAGGVQLVNFRKCQLLANFVEYYLSFQQTPYNFTVNEHIRTFLQTIDPIGESGATDEHNFDDLMYEKSLQFQPKPPAEAVFVAERRLSVVEQRIANLLNLTAPDHRLTADSKEFRALLNVAASVVPSTTAASPATVEQSSTVHTSHSLMGRRPSSPAAITTDVMGTNGSLGRGSRMGSIRTTDGPGCLSPGQPRQHLQNCPAAVAGTVANRAHLEASSNTCPPHRYHHPPRDARSTSSSPAPPNPTITSPHPLLSNNAATSSPPQPPPLLPPRSTVWKENNRLPEQFVNQWQVSGWLASQPSDPMSCEGPFFEPTNSSLPRVDGSPTPPVLPPRSAQRAGLARQESYGNESIGLSRGSMSRAPASVSPSLNTGPTVSTPSSLTRYPKWNSSSLHDSPATTASSADPSPPCLPPRLHSRAPSICSVPGNGSSLLPPPMPDSPQKPPASLSRSGTQPPRMDLYSNSSSSPPPLPPKRQTNNRGVV